MININNTTRILVLGSPGAGKTTITDLLSTKLELPVLHIDNIYWKDAWIKYSNKEISDSILLFLQNKKWIIDGNYQNFYLNRRINDAELIIFLDFNSIISIYRVIKRHIKYISSPNNKSFASNKINLKFILSIIFNQRKRNKEIRNIIFPYSYKVLIIKNSHMLNKYLYKIGVNYE